MKFDFDLMDAVIKDLKSRGASVMVVVNTSKHKNSQVRGDWYIDVKWKTGRHWIIKAIEGVVG